MVEYRALLDAREVRRREERKKVARAKKLHEERKAGIRARAREVFEANERRIGNGDTALASRLTQQPVKVSRNT
mgnify:CR=1 FL=1